MFWCGACTGAREPGAQSTPPPPEPQQSRGYYSSVITPYRLPHESRHTFDKTETDLEYGRLEPATHYHRPHGAHRYVSDTTEVDLTFPLPSLPASENNPTPAERDK
jgi:hypothetical protein